MATHDKNRQKRLEQKKNKRKLAQKKQTQGSGFPMLPKFSSVDDAPIHECWMSDTFFESGKGTVVVSRKAPSGGIVFGAFLLDVYCLGVKDCFSRMGTVHAYDHFRRENEKMYNLQTLHQTCARKLIEGAVEYADHLGFKPCKDFKRNRWIFEKIDASACPTSFSYGYQGKPFYVPGPDDDLSVQKRILDRLKKAVGDDGYHYAMAVGDDWDDDDDDRNDDDGEQDSPVGPFRHVSFEVSYDPIENAYTKRMTKALEKKNAELHQMVLRDPNKAIPMLEAAIKEHPDIVQFQSHLAAACSRVGDTEKARKTVETLIHNEPDYLFAKTNYALLCLEEGQVEKIPEIFNGRYELRSLYPEREVFHVSEVMGFYFVMGRYFHAKGKPEQVDLYLDIMKKLEPDHQMTKALERLRSPELFSNLLQSLLSRTKGKR